MRKGYNPTLEPDAFIDAIAYGHRIGGDLTASSVRDFAGPAADGPAWLMDVCSLPAGRRFREMRLQHLLGIQPVEHGFMLLPEGVDPPRLLQRLGWRKGGRMLDDLSGLLLDVYEGPMR
jgi:hypothetical protein